MASLDNFHTTNGSQPRYPGIPDRNRWIQYGLQSSASRMWNLPGAVPVSPVQPYDPGVRTSNLLSPTLEEPIHPRSDRSMYVPVVPTALRRLGDTVEGVQLYDPCPTRFGRNRGPMAFRSWFQGGPSNVGREVPLQRYTRFHPYTS